LRQALDAAGKRAGRRIVEDILASYAIGADITESEREDDFLELCDRFHIPRPLCNRPMMAGGCSLRPDF
jgi:hypothetical protein